MTQNLQIKNIHGKNKSNKTKTSAHVTHFHAWYIDGEGNLQPIIYKENKKHGEEGMLASQLEASFSSVALSFINAGLTPPQELVYEDNQVVGITSENMGHMLYQQFNGNDNNQLCYFYLDKALNFHLDPITPYPFDKHNAYGAIDFLLSLSREDIKAAFNNIHNFYYINFTKTNRFIDFDHYAVLLNKINDIYEQSSLETISPKLLKQHIAIYGCGHHPGMKNSFQFLDAMPQGFFASLLRAHHTSDGSVSIDMDSLASILTASYILEEDDLHKGNIGFYVTQDQAGNKKFTFFKIDHDLMMSDSIMSRLDSRLANVFYNTESFKITVDDLERFPDLQNSGNHYWPTVKSRFVKGNKAYKDALEREAFKALNSNKAFVKAKWRSFLKYILLPEELILAELIKHLDPHHDKDKIDMIKMSLSSRINHLRFVLLNTPGFRNYLNQLTLHETDQEFNMLKEALQIKEENIEELKKQILQYQFVTKNKTPKQEDVAVFLIDRKQYRTNSTPVMRDQQKSEILKSVIDRFIVWNSINQDAITQPDPNVVDLNDAEIANNITTVTSKRFYYALVAKDLISKDAKSSDINSDKLSTLNAYLKPNSEKRHKDMITLFFTGIDKSKEKLNYTDFTTIIENLLKKQEELSLSLPQLKKITLDIFRMANLDDTALAQIREELAKKKPNYPLTFINQLQSKLWLVRKYRGLYGATTTGTQIIKEIDIKFQPALAGVYTPPLDADINALPYGTKSPPPK